MSRSRIVLLVLAAVALLWLAWGTFSRQEMIPAPSAPPAGDAQAWVDVQQTMDVAGPVRLEFYGFVGSLSIKPGAPGKLEIDAMKTAYGQDEDSAAKNARDLPVTIRKEEGRVVFDARPALGWPGRVDYRITAPEQSGLSMANGQGQIDVSGLHLGVDVSGDGLPVRLGDVRGDVSVVVKSGNVSVDGADGAVRLSTGQGDIQVAHVSGPSLDIAGSNGISISESTVAGQLTLTTTGNSVSLVRTRAVQMALNVPTGSVSLTDVTADRALRVQGGSGGVSVERSQAQLLAVASKGAGVDLSDVQGSLDLATAGGPLTLFNVTPTSLAIASGGGNVVLTGSLPGKGATTIDTGGGELQITIAKETAFALDADAGGGELSVAQALLGGRSLSGSAAKVRINGGGPQVQLRTHGGTLQINTN